MSIFARGHAVSLLGGVPAGSVEERPFSWVAPSERTLESPHAMGNTISSLLVYAGSNYEKCVIRR